MAKYLIVNADDFGMCHSANEAVFDLFRKNKLYSSTIMMPCPAAEEAVKFAVENPEYPIGVHLTLTSEWKKYRWKPLTDSPSLLDKDGFMWHESPDVERHAKLKEIENEIRAQIDMAHSLGMKPSHVDNHMGSLYGHYTGRLSLCKLALRVLGEYGYSYRMFLKADKRLCPEGVPYFLLKALSLLSSKWAKQFNVILPDYLLFPDWNAMKKKNIRHGINDFKAYQKEILVIWTNIPDGVTETFIHPALESDELKSITSMWHCRVAEYMLMNDEYTHKYLEEHGVKMISYRELIEMKSKK